MNLKNIIIKDIYTALIQNNIFNITMPIIVENKKIKLGHYQINNLINISRTLNMSPFDLFKIIEKNIQKDIYEDINYSQPGFINFVFSSNWLSQQLEKIFTSFRLGIKTVQKPQTIVIDYSSPNVAKEMHVGHLRSTIIGDVITRVLDFLGHNVIRSNHIGDWGLQFGMLIAYLKTQNITHLLQNNCLPLKKLEKIYCIAKKKYDFEESFSKKSKKYLVKLQNEDTNCLKIWKKIVSITMHENYKIYKKLNVTLNKNHTMGESIYKSMLPEIIKDLKKKKIAIEKNNEIIVYLRELKNKLGHPMGVIIQKNDKRFLYSTTEIACFKYRYQILHANRIIYYTDIRQHQHLLQAWMISQKAQYIPNDLLLEHHSFGMMLSNKKRPFKTRDGNTIKLSALLNEATERAIIVIRKKKPYLKKKNIIKLANIIGISAVKYYDLSRHRSTNYVFDWNSMLSFEGNTAPYIQYAYTRILSIIKKINISIKKVKKKIILTHESEIKLSIKILEFEEIITSVSQNGTPHLLCQYLYQLATCFSIFYETCSILFPKKIQICHSRIKLSILTAKTLKKGLRMLGISIVKKM